MGSRRTRRPAPGTRHIKIIVRDEETKVEVTSGGGGPNPRDNGRAKVRSFRSRCWSRIRKMAGFVVGTATLVGTGVAIWAIFR